MKNIRCLLVLITASSYLLGCVSLGELEIDPTDDDSGADAPDSGTNDPDSETNDSDSETVDPDTETDSDIEPIENGLHAVYYRDVTFMYGKHAERIDPEIDFNWGDDSPVPTEPPLMGHPRATERFCIRWTGSIKPNFSETYTFTVVADDGVKLWVNNKRIINHWNDKGEKELSGTIDLIAGEPYRLKIEYFDLTDSAKIQLFWSSPSQPKEIVPTTNLFTEYENLLLEPMHVVNSKIQLISAHYVSIHNGSSLFEGNLEMRLNKPEGTQPGDVMFIILGMSGGFPDVPPAGFPSGGWTQIVGGFNPRDPSDINVFGFYKICEDEDPALYKISKFHQKFVTIFTLRGVDIANPIVDKGSSDNTGGYRNVAPSVNSEPGGALITGYAYDDAHVANPIDGMYLISSWHWGDDSSAGFIEPTNGGQTGTRVAVSTVQDACCGGNNAAISFTVRAQ